MPRSSHILVGRRSPSPHQGPTPATSPRSARRGSVWNSLTEAIMVGPAILLVVAFVIVPIGIAVGLSLTNWDGFSPDPDFVGLANYLRIFRDPGVAKAAAFTVTLAVIGTIGTNVLGLGTALLLSRATLINAIMRGAVFYPYVVGAIIVGFIWSAILGSNGAINTVLRESGLDTIPFLSSASFAQASTIAVIIWSSFGMCVVLYLAGLGTIPESLLEAAKLDGLNGWQTLRLVKIPLLAPVVTVNVVLVLINLLRSYETVLALTYGGPAGATQTLVFSVLNVSFASSQLGFGSAQAVLLMICIALVTVALIAARRRAEKDVT